MTPREAKIDRTSRLDKAPIVRDKATGQALGVIQWVDEDAYVAITHGGQQHAQSETDALELILYWTDSYIEGV